MRGEKISKKRAPFDNELYSSAQKDAILGRASLFDKLYLEIGGRLTFDGHAERVLPGYDPENKVTLLRGLGKQAGMLYCIASKDIESGEEWSDTGMTVEELALKETRQFEKLGIKVIGLVATRFTGQKKVLELKKRLARKGKKLFFTYEVPGYPFDMKKVFGPDGFDAQELIPCDRKIIIVTGAGANSGKMFTCLSQVYLENRKGISSGFAKWETFPIWNLPISHEVNIAYEAATADIGDYLEMDHFHKKAHGIDAVNYNRDMENFSVLLRIILKAVPKGNRMHKYHSPTDMGLNRAKVGIMDDEKVRAAAREEILRRYGSYSKLLKGEKREEALARMKKILKKVSLIRSSSRT